VRVESLCEPLTSASAVWNRMLAHWQRLRSEQPSGSGPMPLADHTGAPDQPARLPTVPVASAEAPAEGAAEEADPQRPTVHPRRALAVLDELTALDGLIFVALVDGQTGKVRACPARGPDIDRAAVAAAEIWKTHRRTLRQLGHARPGDPLEEILVTAGSKYHILRTLRAHPDLFILAVLDKLRSNLAMTRYRIMEAQQVLL
jgi:hypothetical protein